MSRDADDSSGSCHVMQMTVVGHSHSLMRIVVVV